MVFLTVKVMGWGRRESNPHAFRHMILSHACLPIPALPQAAKLYANEIRASMKQDFPPFFLTKFQQRNEYNHRAQA